MCREKKSMLLTAFQGTSSEMLLKEIEDEQVLILPNDKEKDSELFIKTLSKAYFDYVLSFGQRQNIKDKVHIETSARNGDLCLDTVFDCEGLRLLFEKNGIPAKISHNAGTSFCNKLYWNGLKYIAEQELETRMVFVHVPFVKNISDIDAFKKRIFEIIRIFM